MVADGRAITIARAITKQRRQKRDAICTYFRHLEYQKKRFCNLISWWERRDTAPERWRTTFVDRAQRIRCARNSAARRGDTATDLRLSKRRSTLIETTALEGVHHHQENLNAIERAVAIEFRIRSTASIFSSRRRVPIGIRLLVDAALADWTSYRHESPNR